MKLGATRSNSRERTAVMTNIETRKEVVLVEGPLFGDAKFYSEWLLAAAEEEGLWRDALDPKAFSVGLILSSSLGVAASILLMELFTDLNTIVADAWRWHQAHPRGYGDRSR